MAGPFAALRRIFDRVVLIDPRWDFLFGRDDSGEVVSIDCETTGFDTRTDDIVSIAAIKIRGSRILASEAFRAVVKPEARLSAEAIKVHQLRRVDVAEGRPIREVMRELLTFVGARPLVGYWIDFDCRMLDKPLFDMLAIHLPNRRIEVSSLYWDRKYGDAPPGTTVDLSFAAIMADLDLPPLAQHDAFNDALLAAEMYVVLKDMAARGIRIPRRGPSVTLAPPTG